MNDKSNPPPPSGGTGTPGPGDEPESASPVGDMFAAGETEVGPHPSLINLENWEESDLVSAATDGRDPGTDDEKRDDEGTKTGG